MTQSTDVFRTMTDEECQAFLREMRDEVRPLYQQLQSSAASTLRLRPVFLGKQPFEKRCQMIRKAMALKVNGETASETLAAFFLDRYGDDVEELLDALKLEHDDGVLKNPSPAPPDRKSLVDTVKQFRQGEKRVMRGILLKAFAAQPAIDWPDLDEIAFPSEAVAKS